MLSFRNEAEVDFTKHNKTVEFTKTKPALEEMLKRYLHDKMKRH